MILQLRMVAALNPKAGRDVSMRTYSAAENCRSAKICAGYQNREKPDWHGFFIYILKPKII
jgi:hypothetical protein